MATLGVTRMSSKGQIVIPASMRKNLKVGDDILVIQDDERIILKKSDRLTEQIKEDLEFARRTEEARRRHERGDFIEMDADDFLAEMEKW